MKKNWIGILVCFFLCHLYASDTIRIMPLGNSITEAAQGHASYRCWLWKMLTDKGYTIDFVGSRKGVHSGGNKEVESSCPYGQFDDNHEGHYGWEANEILWGSSYYGETQGSLSTWIRMYHYDIVLLHIGTNDLSLDEKVENTIQEISFIIDTLRVVNPGVIVLLAQLIPCKYIDSPILEAFNARIPGLAQEMTTIQSFVLPVDHHSDFQLDSDTYDGVHPDSSGEWKMAFHWYKALDSLFQTYDNVKNGAKTEGGRLTFNGGFIVINDTKITASPFFMADIKKNPTLILYNMTGKAVTPQPLSVLRISNDSMYLHCSANMSPGTYVIYDKNTKKHQKILYTKEVQ